MQPAIGRHLAGSPPSLMPLSSSSGLSGAGLNPRFIEPKSYDPIGRLADALPPCYRHSRSKRHLIRAEVTPLWRSTVDDRVRNPYAKGAHRQMTSVIKQPCDEGVIRSTEAKSPCAPKAGPWVLAATILGTSMAFIDETAVTVALPTIQWGPGRGGVRARALDPGAGGDDGSTELGGGQALWAGLRDQQRLLSDGRALGHRGLGRAHVRCLRRQSGRPTGRPRQSNSSRRKRSSWGPRRSQMVSTPRWVRP